MKWRVQLTSKADAQLFDIVRYIAIESDSMDVAMRYYEKLKRKFLLLEEQPYLGRQPRDNTVCRKGYRVLVRRGIYFFTRLMKRRRL